MTEWGLVAAAGAALVAFVWGRARRAVVIEVGPVSSGWLREQSVNREGYQP